MNVLIQPIFQDILDSASDLIFVFDADGKILFVNNAWKNTLGYTETDVADLTIEKITALGYKLRTSMAMLTAERYGEASGFSTVLLAKNKRKINLSGTIYCKAKELDDEPLIFRAMLSNETEKLRAEKLQSLYYKIAKIIETGIALPDLYNRFYQELRQILPIDSFVVGLHDEKQQTISFPFFVNSAYSQEQGVQGEYFIRYAINTFERPMFLYEEVIKQISQKHLPKMLFPPAKVWMGVPLIVNKQHIGILVVQSFRKREDYSKRDLELLHFVSSQLAGAILRYQNEEKIRTQAARLKAIFESGSHLMWSVDRTAHITSLNENFQLLISKYYHIDSFSTDHNLLELVGKYEKKNDFLLKWIYHYRMAFKGLPQQFEIKFIQETLEENWWEVYLNPIYDREGNITEVSAVAHDITQKKITELILAESELKFRNIFESFQDVYFRTNPEGIVNMVSPSVSELLGESATDVIGRNILSFTPSTDNIEELMQELFTHGEVRNYESAVRLANGTEKNVISNFRLIYDDNGKIAGIEGVARDITELKKAIEQIRLAKEEAEHSLEVKKRFLSNMSHEIRTPMNGIIGMLELLNNTNLQPTQREYLQIIRTSSETLLNILNDILDLSKIEAGKMEARYAPVNVRNTIEKLITLFRQRAMEQDTDLTYSLELDVPNFILTDETRLLQILSNLTSNAVKFTQNGTVTIHVRVEALQDNHVILAFDVKDTGFGIPPEKLDLLFKQFSQLDNNTYTKAQSGTGLGLVISKELVTLLGGEIKVVSQEGKGSTFSFTITAKPVSEAEANISTTKNKSQEIAFTHAPSILVVDDNLINLRVAEGMLTKAGCKTFTAQSGQKAIDMLAAVHFDLVFMDIQMPQMDGITAAKAIKAMQLPVCPPIIAMTAFSMVEEREMFLQEGMDDYIAKPITQEALLTKIKKWTLPNQDISKVQHLINTSPAIPILDESVFDSMKKYGDTEFLRNIYTDFIGEAEQLVNQIREAIYQKDNNLLQSSLHTLKGTSATLGANRISEKALMWEKIIKNNLADNSFENDYKELYYELINFKSSIAYMLAKE